MSDREESTAAERARIVRELHDLASHAVAQVLVHAGALAAQPEAAATRAASVEAIRQAASSALRDLRRIHALTDGDATMPYGPQPDLGALADLLDDLRRSGMVRETAFAATGAVPPDLALGAYRFVQRVLEGVRRLDGAAIERLAVGSTGRALSVDVTIDPGKAATAPELAGALVPACQRARLHGGTFSLTRSLARAWSCRAELPL